MGSSNFDRQLEEMVETSAKALGRFLSGLEMDGTRRTDAGFLRKGGRVLDGVEGRVGKWSYLPYAQRSLIRLGGLGTLGGGGYTYWRLPEQTLEVLPYGGAGAFTLAAAGGIVHGIRNRGQAELFKEWVEPLHLALVGPLGISPHTDPRSYLHVPKNFSDDDAVIRVDLPVALGFNESAVMEAITQKLALQGVSFSWTREGRKPYVLARKVQRPPSKVVFSDPRIRALVEGVPESAPLIGLERGDKVVSVDLDAESPHVLVNAGTGGGKSVILRTIAAQLIHHGALAYVLDFKRVSHQWARGVPNVTYCRDIADIHEALIALGEEGRRRIHAAEKLGDDADASTVGPRLVILLEEINATMKQLTRYWDSIKEKGDPKVSPAVDALAEILFMGRAVRLNVLLVAQSATARALGGPEMRENFATRILARYTQNAWRMLVPEVHPAPKSTRHIGRAQVVLGGVAHGTQVMFMTDGEARAWAMSGPSPKSLLDSTPAPPVRPQMPEHAEHLPAAVAGAQPAKVPASAEKELPPADPAPSPPVAVPAEPVHAPPVAVAEQPALLRKEPTEVPVGLRKAQEELLPELTLNAIRWARANDPDFPKHASKKGAELLYLPSDLVRWGRNRQRASTNTTPSFEDSVMDFS